MKVTESWEPQMEVDMTVGENMGSSKGNAGAVQHGKASHTQLVNRSVQGIAGKFSVTTK